MVAKRIPPLHEVLDKIYAEANRFEEDSIRATLDAVSNAENWGGQPFVTIFKLHSSINDGTPEITIAMALLQAPRLGDDTRRIFDASGTKEIASYATPADLIAAGWRREGIETMDAEKQKFVLKAIDEFKGGMQ